MASVSARAGCTTRLTEQLQALSAVAETLTYRLLELEERLAAQECALAPLLEEGVPAEPAAYAEMEGRMQDTEERLVRIEALLNGLQAPPASRHLHSLQPPPTAGPPREEEFEEHPFPEEGEQPFMDELIA